MIFKISFTEMIAFNKNGLRICFEVEKLMDSPTTTVVNVIANNDSPTPFTEFLFQAAVPRVCCSS